MKQLNNSFNELRFIFLIYKQESFWDICFTWTANVRQILPNLTAFFGCQYYGHQVKTNIVAYTVPGK